jgi:hypothetical protein
MTWLGGIILGLVAGAIGALVEHFLPEIKTATREIAGHDYPPEDWL